MSIPSLLIGGHDHYTPEIRDKILEKLCAASLDETAYQMLTPARLRALAEIEATGATVVSFYMQLSPDRRLGGAWRTFFSSLCDATQKPIEDRRQREELRGELDRIGQLWKPNFRRSVVASRSSRARNWACGVRSPYQCLCPTVRG